MRPSTTHGPSSDSRRALSVLVTVGRLAGAALTLAVFFALAGWRSLVASPPASRPSARRGEAIALLVAGEAFWLLPIVGNAEESSEVGYRFAAFLYFSFAVGWAVAVGLTVRGPGGATAGELRAAWPTP